ncbi:hypothetical protein IGI04_002091 [Brassica rapa subsp. trilocularis]|uniref:RNA-binding S4 domain-containing protein n=1 Tax=Brassica rapa subsp. trilocularis TaxID=1813537 RepID=A0ABQ7NXT5_BRACM|nr:hypothetical protein IGI04_002091 [Brassica rapa subsp. trilocularis]
MPTLETPNSETGAKPPITTTGGDASTQEKAKDAQAYDVDDSDSEPEPNKEISDGAARTDLEVKPFWLIKWWPIVVKPVAMDKEHIVLHSDRRDRMFNESSGVVILEPLKSIRCVLRFSEEPVAKIGGDGCHRYLCLLLNTNLLASLRIDGVASAGFKISRSKLVNLISSGDIRVNWATVTKNGTMVKTGDVVSVTGKGRLKVRL